MSQGNALIGHSGFVGSNLRAQRPFDVYYNSGNFRDMAGEQFEQVVCAGISAVKWQANKEPQRDRQQIQALQSVLEQVQCQRFVLISTIDVYPVIQGQDESYNCHQMENHAYGSHRLEFEDFCADQFEDCHIIRLPALFGPGLKKNVIYDLLHDNCLAAINPASSFQYYDLGNLARDIEVAISSDLPLVNFFTEPVPTSAILQQFFANKKVGQDAAAESHYDLQTSHAKLWNKAGRYLYNKDEVLEQMSAYIHSARDRS